MHVVVVVFAGIILFCHYFVWLIQNNIWILESLEPGVALWKKDVYGQKPKRYCLLMESHVV